MGLVVRRPVVSLCAACVWLLASCAPDDPSGRSGPDCTTEALCDPGQTCRDGHCVDNDQLALVDGAITAASGSDEVAQLERALDGGGAAAESEASSADPSQSAAADSGASEPAPESAESEPEPEDMSRPAQPAQPAPATPASPMMNEPTPDPCDRAETCDGHDEDCDGETDEGFSLQSDRANCGICGTRCGKGQSCCAGRCVDTSSSPTNCGTCGQVCTGLLQACCSGVCKTLCVL